MRPIDERILQHRCWLDRGMIIKTLTGIRPERRRARIRPHIGAITSSFPERDVVDVRRCPLLEKRQRFVLRAVKAAHPGIGLCPDDKIDGKQTKFDGGRMNEWQPEPIDESPKDPAVS